MGFAQREGHLREKFFSDSLLSAILISHIKVALFIFPKSIDKEVFSTMPIYYRCFLYQINISFNFDLTPYIEGE